MKITCISDTHNSHNDLELPKGDILIFAGDINCCGPFEEMILRNFTDWFKKQDFKYKIVIGGNHDALLSKLSIKNIKDNYFDENNIYYLENTGCTIEGIKFWGSPITPIFNDWFFMAKRGDEIAKYWKMIPKNTQVLVTHGPPYNILDLTLDNEHVGCYDLGLAIKKIKPKYHIFGHIHLQGSQSVFQNGTTFINASVLDEEYDLVNTPITFDYE